MATGKENGIQDEEIYAAYAQMFPHSEDGSCAKHNRGWKEVGCTAAGLGQDQYENYHWDGEFEYAWCKVAYRDWIDAKIIELKAQPRLLDVAA